MAECYHAFFRHGDYAQRKGVPSARQPWALTEAGKAQAREGATVLDGTVKELGLRPSAIIYCSHQLRAWQTAQVVAETLRDLGHDITEIRETAELAERGLGSAANLTVTEIEAALEADPRFETPPQGWKSDSDYRLPLEGAESLMMAGARVARHLVTSGQPGKLTLHVGHGASFRHACHHLGILTHEEIARLSMFHAQPSLICHQNDAKWRHVAGEWKIREPGATPRD
ncbi:histidine phosphatase family protein [Amaricoccus tamworthensis]|uniref:histidine phosphatase family protein n=1 Tax=Amaricoccus tamworthensis TaxID=57002 RepID=UPI003C7D29B1